MEIGNDSRGKSIIFLLKKGGMINYAFKKEERKKTVPQLFFCFFLKKREGMLKAQSQF